MSDESPFLEDQALHAALREDEEALDAVLEKMLPGELMALASTCDELAVVARRKSYVKRGLDHYGQTPRRYASLFTEPTP